jgi:hypothetical protein
MNVLLMLWAQPDTVRTERKLFFYGKGKCFLEEELA